MERPLRRETLEQAGEATPAMGTGEAVMEHIGEPHLELILAETRFGAPYIDTEVSDRRRTFWLEENGRGRGQARPLATLQTVGGLPRAVHPIAVLREIEMHGGEQREVLFKLGIPEQAKPGEFLVFHIFQHTEMGVVGGDSVVALVTS